MEERSAELQANSLRFIEPKGQKTVLLGLSGFPLAIGGHEDVALILVWLRHVGVHLGGIMERKSLALMFT